jgi:hypothetical protein
MSIFHHQGHHKYIRFRYPKKGGEQGKGKKKEKKRVAFRERELMLSNPSKIVP